MRSTVPVVFLNGTADTADPPANVAGATATMPNALLVSVPGTGHFTLNNATHPGCLLAATTAFIQAGQPASPAAWVACTRALAQESCHSRHHDKASCCRSGAIIQSSSTPTLYSVAGANQPSGDTHVRLSWKQPGREGGRGCRRPAVTDAPRRMKRAGQSRRQGTTTGWITTGPSVGSSSVAWETPGGVIVSMALGTVVGSTEQIGSVPPGAQTPNVNAPGVAVKARAWSGLKPSWPVSATVNTQPEPAVPNSGFGHAIVIVLSALVDDTNGGVPTVSAGRVHPDRRAKPWTSSSSLQASAGAIE